VAGAGSGEFAGCVEVEDVGVEALSGEAFAYGVGTAGVRVGGDDEAGVEPVRGEGGAVAGAGADVEEAVAVGEAGVAEHAYGV
jgi:hypothetical protein